MPKRRAWAAPGLVALFALAGPLTSSADRGALPGADSPPVSRAGTTSIPAAAGAATGRISGRVTDAEGDPVEGAAVYLFAPFRSEASRTSGTDGSYRFDGLAAGFYRVAAEAPGLRAELYPQVPCPAPLFSGCAIEQGEAIPVPPDQHVRRVDLALERLSRISGRLTDAATGGPVASLAVSAFTAADERLAGATVSRADGGYEIRDLYPGAYLVMTRGFADYVHELHGGVHCPPDPETGVCAGRRGTPVAIGIDDDAEGIDFELDLAGSIEGRLTVEANGDEANALVRLFDARGERAAAAFSSHGVYRIPALPGGVYFVRAEEAETAGPPLREPLVGELYRDRLCPAPGVQSCDARIGTPISVTLGRVTPDVDFVLGFESFIFGEVTTASGEPLSSALVDVYDVTGRRLSTWVSFPDGRFGASVARGTFYLSARGRDFALADELYDGLPCSLESCDPREGTPVVVGDGEERTGVTFTLDPGGTISGTVADLRAEPLGTVVTAWSRQGRLAGETVPDAGGRYRLEHLAADGYFVVARPVGPGLGELYGGRICTGGADPGCDPTEGTPVTVTDGATTDGIDLTVRDPGPFDCVPSATRLCLADGRFQVAVEWAEALDHDVGHRARAEPLTGNTGSFWFFRPDNVELLVKVLDACGPPFDGFWVFAAGLTNVDVRLRVTDTGTGELWERHSPLGLAFEPVLDTSAFATCP